MEEILRSTIARHYELSVSDLADFLQLTPSELNQHCHNFFKASSKIIVESTRLSRVLSELYASTDLQRACACAGYDTLRTLRYAFERRFHCTPSTCREAIVKNKKEFKRYQKTLHFFDGRQIDFPYPQLTIENKNIKISTNWDAEMKII